MTDSDEQVRKFVRLSKFISRCPTEASCSIKIKGRTLAYKDILDLLRKGYVLKFANNTQDNTKYPCMRSSPAKNKTEITYRLWKNITNYTDKSRNSFYKVNWTNATMNQVSKGIRQRTNAIATTKLHFPRTKNQKCTVVTK